MFGATRPNGMRLLAGGLLAASLVGLPGCRLARLRCPVPGWILGLALAGLAAGWYHVVTGPAVQPTEFTRQHLARLLARWPKSMVEQTPWVLATQAAGLFGAFILAATLSTDRVWRLILATTIVLSATSIALLGLWQNYHHYETILGESPGGMTGYFFGTFFHHTSAGAMINLAWPVAATMGLAALFHDSGTLVGRLLAALPWMGAVAVLLAGHLGHISRMPQLLALFAGVALLLGVGSRFAHGRGLQRLPVLLVASLLIAGTIFWLTRSTERIGQITERWARFFHPGVSEAPATANWPPPETEWSQLLRDDLMIPLRPGISDRQLGCAAAVRLALQAGPLGFGPGTWAATASHVFTEPFMRTFFLWVEFAHMDYLQFVIEWGWFAGSGLLLLFVGGLSRAAHRIHDAMMESHPPDRETALAIGSGLSLLIVGCQSLMDFPLQIPSLQVLFFLQLALCWGIPSHPLPSACPPTPAI